MVLPQQAATGRRRPPKSGASRDVTVVPNLFVDDGLVHRFDGNDQPSISRFFAKHSGTSALICGNTETVLSRLPDGVFQSCVTSPPYWSLRDYNILGQIGLEDSVFAYIEHLTKVFAQVRRVLKGDRTLWLNIGDSYPSDASTPRPTSTHTP